MTNEEKIKELEAAFTEYTKQIKALEEEYDQKIKDILREIEEDKLKTIKRDINS